MQAACQQNNSDTGTLKPMQNVAVFSGPDSTPFNARVNQVLKFEGLERKRAGAGMSARPG